uniref:Homeobox domain-containing protein n=1 Tax=Schistosoma mansoni TaxID=6183 RepID=A0A5K4F4A0_SCHMA
MPRRRCSSPINTTANNVITNNHSNNNNHGRTINTSSVHHHHHSTHNNLRFRGGRTSNGISPSRNRLLDTSQETQDCHVSSTTTNLMQEIQSFPIVTTLQLQQSDPELEADKKFIMSHPLYPLLALLLQQCELATARPDSPPPLDTFNTELTSYIQHRIELQQQAERDDNNDENEDENAMNKLKSNSLKLNREKLNKITEKYKSTEDIININDNNNNTVKTTISPRYNINHSSTNQLSTTNTITHTTNTIPSNNTTNKMNSATNIRNIGDCFLPSNNVNNDISTNSVYNNTTNNNDNGRNRKSLRCDKSINHKNNSNYVPNDDNDTDVDDELRKLNCTLNDERKYQFLSNNSELNELIVKAIQVLRIHLLELHKVNELCKDFCSRYIYSLKSKFQSDPLIHDSQPSSPGESEAVSPVAPGCYNPRYPPHHHHHMLGPNLSCHPGPTDMIPPGYQRHLSSRLDDDSLCGSSDVENLRLDCLHSSSLPNSRTGYDMNGSCYTPNFHMVNYNSPYFMDKSVVQDGSVSCDESLSQLHSFLSPYGSTALSSAAFHASLDGLYVGGKQKRGVLPKRATQIMKQWLFQHLVHPYPTEDEKRHIAGQTNLTLLQVNNWFINARRRILQPMLDSSNFVPHGNNCNNVDGSSDRLSNSMGCNESHVISKKKKAATSRPSNNRFWPASLVAAAAIHPAAAGLVSSGSSNFTAAVNSGINITNSNHSINTNPNTVRPDCRISERRSNSLDEVISETSIGSTPKQQAECTYTPQTYDSSSIALPQSPGHNQSFDCKLSSDLWNLDTRMDLLNSQKFYFSLQSGVSSTKVQSNINDNTRELCNNKVFQNGTNSSSLSSQNLSFSSNSSHCLNPFSSTLAMSTDLTQTIPGKYDSIHENLSIKQSDETITKRLTPSLMSSISSSSSSSCSTSKDIDQCTDSVQQKQNNNRNGRIDKNYVISKPVNTKSSVDNNLFRSEINNNSNNLVGVKSERNFQEFNPVLQNLPMEPNNGKMNLLANRLLESDLINSNDNNSNSNNDNTNNTVDSERDHLNTLNNDDSYGIQPQNDVTVPMMMMNSSSNYPQDYSSMLLSHAQNYSNYLSNNISIANNLLSFDVHPNNLRYSHTNKTNNSDNNNNSLNQLNYTSHSYSNTITNPTGRPNSGFNHPVNFSTSNVNDTTVTSFSTIPLHHQQQHDSLSPTVQQKTELPCCLTDQWSNITPISINQFTHNLNTINQYSTFPSSWTNKLKSFNSSALQIDNGNIDSLSGSSDEDIQHHRHSHHNLESENGQFMHCLQGSALLNRNEETNTDQSTVLHSANHQLIYNLPSDMNNLNYTHTELGIQESLNSKSIYPVQYDQHHHHHSQYDTAIPTGNIGDTCTENDDNSSDNNNNDSNSNNKISLSFFKSPSTGLLTKSTSTFQYHNS